VRFLSELGFVGLEDFWILEYHLLNPKNPLIQRIQIQTESLRQFLPNDTQQFLNVAKMKENLK
jgi:hypothetical protein